MNIQTWGLRAFCTRGKNRKACLSPILKILEVLNINSSSMKKKNNNNKTIW